MSFSFQIVGFKSRSSVVVKCFESREEDECDIIFKTEDVRNFPEVIPKKNKDEKKKGIPACEVSLWAFRIIEYLLFLG